LSQLVVDEVEVVVEALAGIRLQKGLAGLFVMPRFVAGTAFHRRQNADQAGMVPALLDNRCYPVFLTHVGPAQELDGEPVFGRQTLGVLPNLISQRLGKPGVVENTDLVHTQVSGHCLGVAKSGQRALNHEAVKTLQHSPDLVGMTLGQQCHRASGSSQQKFH
jgi:hypothetical protein